MKKVLIVVDMQEGFMTKQNYVELAKKVENLLKKQKYSQYIFTKFKNLDKTFYQTKLKWFELIDEKSQQLCVKTPKNAVIFEKCSYGLKNEQLKYLKSLNVKSVDICGLQTDACVYAISLQLFDNNIFPNILINYCQTDTQRNEYAKSMLITQFGSVDEKK